MAESSEKHRANERAGRPWWIIAAAVAGVLIIATAYAWLRSVFGPVNLEQHGQLGDALAPVAEVLMLAALLAALYSAHLQRIELGLQRKELALQRKEMRESRDEMVEQRKQLERSAKAQEDLAAAQASLTAAQREATVAQVRANELTASSTRLRTFASLYAIRADVPPRVGVAARDALVAWVDNEVATAKAEGDAP